MSSSCMTSIDAWNYPKVSGLRYIMWLWLYFKFMCPQPFRLPSVMRPRYTSIALPCADMQQLLGCDSWFAADQVKILATWAKATGNRHSHCHAMSRYPAPQFSYWYSGSCHSSDLNVSLHAPSFAAVAESLRICIARTLAANVVTFRFEKLEKSEVISFSIIFASADQERGVFPSRRSSLQAEGISGPRSRFETEFAALAVQSYAFLL